MATEENKEAEAQAESAEKKSAIKNIVHIVEDENSYINSAKERMNDVIDTFLTNAENSVALNDFSLIFKSVTVWIKFRPRKLGQYVEIIPGASDIMLKDEETIYNTRDPVSITDLLGQAVFSATN